MSKRWMAIVLCAVIGVAIPVGAGAQGVSGLIKKKVAETVGKDEKAPQANASGVYNEDVLELTEPVMKGFMNGLRVELAGLGEFADLMDTYKRPEDYERCRGEVAMSPAGMEIAMRLANLPDNATAEEMQRAMAKINEELVALTKKSCGPDAGEDWPQDKRRDRVAAIVARAAAAAGPVGSLPEPMPAGGPAGPSGFEPFEPSAAGFVEAARDSMTLRQYGITEERAENYCRLLEAGAIQPGQAVKYAIPGGKIFWVYSEVEARAIEPQCQEILENRSRKNILLTHVYWQDPMSR